MAVLRGLSGIFAVAVGGCSFAGTGLTAGTSESAGDSSGGGTAGESGASTTTDPTQSPTEEGSGSVSSMPPTSDADPSTTGPGLETTGMGDVSGSSSGSSTVGTTAETGESTAGTGGETTAETGSEGSTGCTQETWYLDADDDGYGLTNSTIQACSQPDGYAGEPDDCDDADKQVNPGAPEKCDNEDNDCDGFVDEWSTMNKDCGGCKLTADDELNPTKTYFFCQSPLAWMAASTSCASKGAALVADEQNVEHNYLLAQLDAIDADSGPWWTGGHKAGALDLTFSWQNGVAIANADSRWVVNPILIDSNHCVRLLSPGVNNGGKWVEDDCADPLPYICEQDN